MDFIFEWHIWRARTEWHYDVKVVGPNIVTLIIATHHVVFDDDNAMQWMEEAYA